MERLYTYKFRIYPNEEQRIFLANVFGCCRLVYNYFLNEKKQQYEKSKTKQIWKKLQNNFKEPFRQCWKRKP